MGAVMLGLTWGIVGLDVGWQPLPGGGVEYTIQIAPHEVEMLKQDRKIESDVPAHLRDIRSYRILVGNEPLRRIDPPKAAPIPSARPEAPSGQAAKTAASPWSFFRGGSTLWEPYRVDRTTGALESGKRAAEKPGSPTQSPSEKKIDGGKEPADSAKSKEPDKPWMPFTVSVVLLFGSFGGNIYLAWLWLEARARYRALLHRRSKANRRHKEDSFDEPEIGEP